MPADLEGEPLLLDLLDGFIRSKVLMTALELGLFATAEDWISRPELLRRHALPERSGTILVNAAIALGLLEEGARGVRTPEALRPILGRLPEGAFHPTRYLIEYYNALYPELARMGELVRTDGASSGFKLRDYFKDDVAEVDPEIAARYSEYMDATIDKIVRVVLQTYDFSGHRYLLDLCGGTGAFAAAILRAHPTLRGGFIDVPACVALGERRLEGEPALAARLQPLAGDIFLRPFPPGADVVTIARAAMDWGDDRMGALYRKVHDALPAGGRFLVIERMIPEAVTPASRSQFLRSVYFLAKSTSTRYRTAAQHTALLRGAGFDEVTARVPAEAPYAFFQGMQVLVATRR